MSKMIAVRTPLCNCGNYYIFEATTDQKIAYENGAYVQDAFGHVAPHVREMFITGICGDCWIRLFGEEE